MPDRLCSGHLGEKVDTMFNTPQEEEYQNKPCIVVMDYACKNKRSGADMDKVLVFKWIPDTCSKIRQKMVYSSAW